MSHKKRYLFLPFIVIIAFVIAMVSTTVNFTAVAADDSFVLKDEVVVSQITDTHYYPISYCAQNGVGDFGDALISSTKLFLESSFIVEQGLKDVISENPDYLLLTGDITLNGELQGHIEMSNLLRELQNTIRVKNNKPHFQIFVVPGNHDIYNDDAARYDHNGKKEVAPCVTRKQFEKIYSSLGYPDLSDIEISDFYSTIEVLTTYLPYNGLFINSKTSDDINIEYQYKDNGNSDDPDYKNGELTYIAHCLSNAYTFIGIDEEVSGEEFEVKHFVGGQIYDVTKDYLAKKKVDGNLDGQTLIGLMHHNALPHFGLEDTLLKDFTIYNWLESADFLADLGMRNIFTGHMHSSDVVSHTSYNGNQIVDTETSSLTGSSGGIRIIKLQRGAVGKNYAENYVSKVKLVSATNVSYLFANNYMDANYLKVCKLAQFVSEKDGVRFIESPSTYAVNKLFVNIIDSVVYSYLRPEFILGLGDMLVGKLPPLLGSMSEIITPLIRNIVIHFENVVLAKYTYGGSNTYYQNTAVGYKLCGYLEELIYKAINIQVNTKGDSLLDFFMAGYLGHIAGTDTNLANTSGDVLQGINNFKSGAVVKVLLDMILDNDKGLYPIIIGLTKPIDLTKDFEQDQLNAIGSILNLLKPASADYKYDPHAIVLDDYVPQILKLLPVFGLNIDFSLNGKKLESLINDTIDGYVTDSLYAGLGEIAGNIIHDFYIDESPDCALPNFSTFYTTQDAVATYVKGAVKNEATIENGKLPSMMTVNFGENTATDKNFVWFTDRRVKNTDIQYVAGDFDEKTATTKSGKTEVIATSTASIDLGVFATLIDVELARHTVELKGLQPNTTYSYRVGSANDGFWSNVYTFKTAPAENEAFEVLLLTDIQGFANSTYQNAAKMMQNVNSVFKDGYDFVINCGDAVDNSKNLLHYQFMLNTMMDEFGNTTQVNVTGNHEESSYKVGTGNKYQPSDSVNASEYNYMVMHNNMSLPKQNTKTGAYYSFDYSSVHFTILNTNDLEGNKLSKAQEDWLINDLKTTKAKFKVVAMHKGAYTAGSHITDKDVIGIRKQVTPIFADNGVSLVLQGHDHVYSETYYLDREGNPIENAATGNFKIGSEGVLYINLGCSGDKFYKYVSSDNIPIEFGEQMHKPTLNNPTFGKLVYDGESLYYRGYQYELDTAVITAVRNNPAAWWIGLAAGFGGSIVVVAVLAIIASAIGHKRQRKTK